MKPLPVFAFSGLVAGFGAVLGSVLGNAFGGVGLFAGALFGGAAATAAAVALAVRFSWLPRSGKTLATVGALLGFAAAAGLAVTHLDSPVVPVLSCGLIGAGALVGAGVAIGLERGGSRERGDPS